MKTRMISGLVGTVLLLAVLFCPYTWVFAVAMALLAALAAWELLHNTGAVPGKLLPLVSMVFAALEVLVIYKLVGWQQPSLYNDLTMGTLLVYAHVAAALLLVAFLLFVALWWLCRHRTVRPLTVGFALLATVYATVGFAALAALRVTGGESTGLWNILLLLVIAFMSDTGAYFVGTFFGKHKMAPVISPKKSWEGFFGGWVVSILCAALLAVIYTTVTDQHGVLTVVGVYAALAAVLAPLSVCGDLLASVVKRHYDIKDYGKLMPGHGGVMDRFDSVVIVAPLLYVIIAHLDRIVAYFS